MKRLILFELIILFLATTFESDSPPGWFQQVLPVNKTVRDIFFLDSSRGWAVTTGGSSSTDTAYILNTTNGGSNWLIQKTGIEKLDAIQFLDNNNGYAVGKLFTTTNLSIYKTTNGGVNWQGLNNITGVGPTDLFFVNKDTGWVCDDNSTFGAGLQKTINGGINWQSQLGASFKPTKLYFLNKDTGWVNCNAVVNSGSYRTTNGGVNWIQFNNTGFSDIYFFNNLTGIKTAGAFYKTTNGGLNWYQATGGLSGGKISFGSDSVGWAGYNLIYIPKTTNNGESWFLQTTNANNPSVSSTNNMLAWAGGNILVHTTDGGGPPVGIEPVGTEIPSEYKLFQNYPNPFNPKTIIRFQFIRSADVRIIVYDIQGKQIIELVNQKQSAGTYEVDFSGNGLSTGVYFYSLIIDGIIVETKRMVLLK